MGKYNYNRIKELLAKYDKSNIDLARYMGVTVKTVSNWCTNSGQPEVEKLFRIAEFLGVEAGELLTLKKDLKG
jgi:transcriptional regulator with XRE-family HTH domain